MNCEYYVDDECITLEQVRQMSDGPTMILMITMFICFACFGMLFENLDKK